MRKRTSPQLETRQQIILYSLYKNSTVGVPYWSLHKRLLYYYIWFRTKIPSSSCIDHPGILGFHYPRIWPCVTA